MSLRHSEAIAKRWAAKTQEERTAIMSALGKKRQEKLGPDGRLQHAKMMVKARAKSVDNF